MIDKKLIPLFIVGFFALAAILFMTSKAECAWCPTYACFGASGCPDQCSCVMAPGETSGNCYSIQ